ncbi:MAG: hypothetical protein WKF71_04050 [Pyrinomonadaceae bacterium]
MRTGDGKQTVFPSSTHEQGESIKWQSDGEPFEVDAQTLRLTVAVLASACLISTFWRIGIRNELNLAVSGALLRNGFEVPKVKNFIKAICFASGDEETSNRLKADRSNRAKVGTRRKCLRFSETC